MTVAEFKNWTPAPPEFTRLPNGDVAGDRLKINPTAERCYFCGAPAFEDRNGIPQCRQGHAKR